MRCSLAGSIVLVCLSLGCHSNVRTLTQTELDALNEARARLQSNQSSIDAALDDLKKVRASAIAAQHDLALSTSEITLLESLGEALAAAEGEMAAVQREAAIYQLLTLAEAERELLNARIDEQTASIDEVKTAYERLVVLTGEAIAAERLILAYLDQPRADTLVQAVDGLVVESQAFRETLGQSDSPRLERLAGEIEKAEVGVAAARDGLIKLLDAVESVQRRKSGR